jgi:hypothetical protein
MAPKARSLLAGSAAVAAIACLSAAGCYPAPETEEEIKALAEQQLNANGELTATAQGDWSKFTNGQCLVAVQNFYPAKFGVSVPVAGAGTGSCASAGACLIWLKNQPSSAEWERIPNGGGRMPSMYDLIVYPPTSGNPYGHIASVDHVEGTQIFVMDSNHVPGGREKKAPQPHTINRAAYGWYHLKKLATAPNNTPPNKAPPNDPPAEPPPNQTPNDGQTVGTTEPCVPGGEYCGGDKVMGNPDTLYTCNDDASSATPVEKCAAGCLVTPGRNDACADEAAQ